MRSFLSPLSGLWVLFCKESAHADFEPALRHIRDQVCALAADFVATNITEACLVAMHERPSTIRVGSNHLNHSTNPIAADGSKCSAPELFAPGQALTLPVTLQSLPTRLSPDEEA